MYFKHKATGDCIRIDNLNDWEFVPEAANAPEPRWQDVTGECEETAHGIRFAQEWAVYNPAGYRFRRVSLEELSDAYYKTIKSRQAAQWFAFIVEREMEL